MDVLAADGSAWRSEFAKRARPFRLRWRRQRLIARALRTLWLPILALAVFVALLRFTLIDLPEDPTWLLLPAVGWGAGLLLTLLLDRPSLARVARAIDTHLDLDERLGTALALSYATPPGAGRRLVGRQRLDALEILDAQGSEAARAFRPAGPQLRRAIRAAAILALVLLPLALLPSPVAGVRAQRAALRATSLAQADGLAALRRILVARPDLAPGSRALIDAQLAAAESALREHPTDRAASVAALSQATDSLRTLLPDNAAQVHEARATAAQALLSALSSVVNNSDVLQGGGSDLTRAATAAAEALGGAEQGPAASRNTQQALASSLERIAAGLAATDPHLAQVLTDTAAALRKDSVAGRQALQNLAKALQDSANQQAVADLLAGALAQLDSTRQDVAQAGLAPAAGQAQAPARPFGRRAPVDAADAAPTPATPGAVAGGDQGSTAGGSTGNGAATGANPADAASNSAAPGQGASRAGGTGSAGPGGTANTTLQGNVQGGGGTQDAGANPGGTGTGRVNVSGTDSGAAGSGAFEPVYVPGSAPAPAQAASGPQDRIPGVESPGQGTTPDSTAIRTGPGYQPGVKTPYSKVIGQYRDAAGQALDQTYIPSDARQYVRDYFDSLAPGP